MAKDDNGPEPSDFAKPTSAEHAAAMAGKAASEALGGKKKRKRKGGDDDEGGKGPSGGLVGAAMKIFAGGG